MIWRIFNNLGYFVAILALCGLAACKQKSDSFGFVDDATPNENEQQGAPQITSVSPTTLAVLCVSPIGTPMCGSASSPPLTTGTSTTFSISVTGSAPITYTWKLNGTVIAGANASNYSLASNPATVPAGVYTLEVTAQNDQGSDTHSFNIKVNQPPILSGASPDTGATKKIRFNTVSVFNISGSDANSDAITYTWKVDGINSATLTGSGVAGGSQGVYSPALANVGLRTITVTASDSHGGYEPSSISWTVKVNRFSTLCNDLALGQICTVVGGAGMGSGKSPATQNSEIYIRPEFITTDSDGDIFFSDSINHVVWFYNQDLDGGGESKTIVGVEVAPGQLKVVMGNGADGNSGDTWSCGATPCPLSGFKLDFPYGVAWDEARQALFVADYNNARIVWGKQDGTVEWVACTKTNANTAASNGGGTAKSQGCYRPMGIDYDSANQILYVAAHDINAIKAFNVSDPDPNNWTGETVVGGDNAAGVIQQFNTNAAPYGDGAVGLGKGIHVGCPGACGTKAMARNPYDVAVGSDGVVFFVSNNDCRLRAINRTGGAKSYFGGLVSVPNNQVLTLSGSWNTCATTAGAYNVARYKNPRGLAVYESAGVKGWFISHEDHHRVAFLNNSGGALTFGDRTIGTSNMNVILGTGTGSYNGSLLSGISTEINTPRGLAIANGKLIFSDRGNVRVRTLDIATDDGAITDLIGENTKFGFDGAPSASATDAILNDPRYLTYDPNEDAIYFADSGNDRIRKVDLLSGVVSTLIGSLGTGGNNGEADADNVAPNIVQGSFFRGLTMLGDALIFQDTENANAVNSNCVVRAYNFAPTTQTILNISVGSDRVRTVGGSWSNGCTSGGWAGSGGAATNGTLRRNMEDVVYDGTNLLLTNYEQHCIQKIAGTTGVISDFVGLCNTNANQDGTIASGTVRLTNPKGMFRDPNYPTNFFLVDSSNATTSYLKYVNQTGTPIDIGDVTASANAVTTIRSIGGYGNAVTAMDNQVCYSSGLANNGNAGSHNVICFDRDDTLLGSVTLRVGPSDNTKRGGGQQGTEQEAIAASHARVLLYAPHGITFDGEGNLWITEQGSHVIRMVKRWWP